MMPTAPSVVRKASSSSPRILIFFGAPSRSGSSLESSAGIQKRRSSSPIGVPLPLLVRNSLSAQLSIHSPQHLLAQPVLLADIAAGVAEPLHHDALKRLAGRCDRAAGA